MVGGWLCLEMGVCSGPWGHQQALPPLPQSGSAPHPAALHHGEGGTLVGPAQPGRAGFALCMGKGHLQGLGSGLSRAGEGIPRFNVTLPQFHQLCFLSGCHLMLLDLSVSRKEKTFLAQQCFLGKILPLLQKVFVLNGQ